MTPRLDDVEALAKAIDRIVFLTPREESDPESQTAALALASYLNESFPRVTLPQPRRDRVQRRLLRAFGIPVAAPVKPWIRLEEEMNRRLRAVDPRWRPVMGGAAILLIGVLGIAVLRQRGGVKGIAALTS